MSTFNQALLTKQCWKLVKNSGSMVAKVYKAWYFWNTNFLNSIVGRRPSTIWRSLICGKELFQQEFRWVVGNKESIFIYKDNWLFKLSFKVVCITILLEDIKVVDLMSGERFWIEALIKSSFIVAEADLRSIMCARMVFFFIKWNIIHSYRQIHLKKEKKRKSSPRVPNFFKMYHLGPQYLFCIF